MFLKKHFKRVLDEEGVPVVDEEGNLVLEKDEHGEPIIDKVSVLRKSKIQKLNPGFINECMQQGFLTVSKGKMIFDTEPGMTYRITRTPSRYCCFDDKKLGSEAEAKQYVEDNYAGEESPDPNNPSGYKNETFFTLELEE